MDLFLFGASATGYTLYKKSKDSSTKPKPKAINDADAQPAPVMALLFAAGWCPDCVDFLPFVKSFIEYQTKKGENLVRFVYVSSDKTEAEMDEFKPQDMAHVPFANYAERDNMKRHYGACAAKEREALGMTPEQRKYGIPTVILLDSRTGDTLYQDATIDLERMDAPLVFKKWKAEVLPNL